MPRSPGIAITDRNGRTTRPSETALIVRCIRSTHSAIGNKACTSAERRIRISTVVSSSAPRRGGSAGAEVAAQVFHGRNEGFYVGFVVVEMKTRPEVGVTVGGHDVATHECLRESAAVT